MDHVERVRGEAEFVKAGEMFDVVNDFHFGGGGHAVAGQPESLVDLVVGEDVVDGKG